MDFLNRLKEYMKENDLKQRDIIDKGNGKISNGYLSMVLSGKRQPNLELVMVLSEMNKKSINWWLYGIDEYASFQSLKKLARFFIDNGDIDSNANMDDDIRNVLNTMLDKEIKWMIENEINH